VPHLTYLSWHRLVELEPPRRPEPDRPRRARPPRARRGVEVRLRREHVCRQCGFVQPTARVRVWPTLWHRRRHGRRTRSDTSGPPSSLTRWNYLAYSPSAADDPRRVVDVDGGGALHHPRSPTPNPNGLRRRCQGSRFTFRRLFTAGGVHDYFWKSHLVDTGSEIDGKAAESLTGSRSSAWDAPGSAKRWDSSTEDLILEAFTECIGSTAEHRQGRHRRVLARHSGARAQSGLTLSRALVHRRPSP